MNALRGLFAHFRAYHSHDQPIIQYSGMIGMAAFPLFYLLRFAKPDAPFNDLWLRALAMALCGGLALRKRWPRRLEPYYLAYAYATLLYCMPFFFVFTSLVNGGGVVGVANTLMAVFFLVLLSDWRNSVVIFILGSAAAVALYMAVVPDPQLPRDYVARLPVLIFVIIGGSVFKFAQKKAETGKVERTYTALAGSIAHEMRNPLSQIKHNLERMQQALPLPTSVTQDHALPAERVDSLFRYVAESERAVKRGLQVIAMTLDEVNAKPVDSSSFSYLSAGEATARAVEEYAFDSEADAAKVSVHVKEDFSFRGEETAYLFVLFNLIKNALYYLTLFPHARVQITVEAHRVKVHDSGPGIPPQVMAQLFQPFRSVGKSGGTGLGLAYCRRVMHAFGGDIECESQVGEYTQFTLRFPPVSEEESDIHRLAVLDRARAAFEGKRLLIVEDDSAQRTTTRHKLQPLGASVDQAANGQRALEALAAQRYDMVLLDLNMPVLDGYAVAERVRRGEVPVNRVVRMVAYTSEPAHLAQLKTQKAGMDGYISKPCAQLPLLQALVNVLESPAPVVASEDALAGRRIVLADDSPHNRKAVAAYLKHAGAEVVEAGHGHEVLEYLRTRGHFDVVLMDISMPGMDGLETARAIRSGESEASGVTIVALTAHSDQRTLQAARDAGMNDVLTKPVEAAALYGKLRQVLGASPAVGQPEVREDVAPFGTTAGLLNLERLGSYRRLGILEELLTDYLPEISRLIVRMQESAAAADLEACLDSLHSLLGMSGEAGAQALYRQVRQVYVPMLEGRTWPRQAGWSDEIAALATQTERALRDYGANAVALAAG